MKAKANPYGGVAQLGEHLPCKQGVMGSIPIISTRSAVPTAKAGETSWTPRVQTEEKEKRNRRRKGDSNQKPMSINGL